MSVPTNGYLAGDHWCFLILILLLFTIPSKLDEAFGVLGETPLKWRSASGIGESWRTVHLWRNHGRMKVGDCADEKKRKTCRFHVNKYADWHGYSISHSWEAHKVSTLGGVAAAGAATAPNVVAGSALWVT